MLKCSVCSACFENARDLIKHIRSKHSLIYSGDIYCGQDNCSRVFQNIDSFRKHLVRIHDPKVANVTESYVTNPEACDDDLIENNEINLIEETLDVVEDEDTSNIGEVMDNIKLLALKFIMDLHSKSSITRREVLFITNDVTTFLFQNVKNLLQKFIFPKVDTDSIKTFETILKFLESPFAEFKTEHKLINYLEKNNLYKKPKEYVVDSSNITDNIYVTNSKVVVPDVKFNFRKFLETNNMLERITDYMSHLDNTTDSGILSNFIHGSMWKKKKEKFEGKLVIPYLLYADDFEINNPLGSKAGKHTIAATYSQILCLPPDISSSLESIIPLMFFRSIEKKINHSGLNSNDLLYHKLIEELNDLEQNGLNVKQSDGTCTTVYMILGLINGDNLGLNEILGFTTSFNSTYSCRICRIDKCERQKTTANDTTLKRTSENYKEDVEINDPSKTGINENCVFHKIESFSVTENVVVDEMHDFLEGNAHYVICKIILDFLHKEYFTLEDLNDKVQNFNYSFNDKKNVPPIIKLEHLKRSKLRFSAEQMLIFINHFALYVCDKILEEDESFVLYERLIQISDLLMKFEISRDELVLLETLITEHHEMYIQLFKDTLKPKMHNMLHYKESIEYFGPLRKFWCMRLEAKHREASQYMHGVASRKNVSLTVAIKAQLKMSQRYLLNENPKSRIFVGTGSEDNLSNQRMFDEFKYVLNEKLLEDTVFIANYVTIYNKRYRYEDIFQIINDNNDNVLYGAQIIFQYDTKIYIICKKFDAELKHNILYEISPTNFFKLIDLETDILSNPSVITELFEDDPKILVRIKEY